MPITYDKTTGRWRHRIRRNIADLAVSALRGYDGPLLLFQDETARLLRRYGLSIATDGTP